MKETARAFTFITRFMLAVIGAFLAFYYLTSLTDFSSSSRVVQIQILDNDHGQIMIQKKGDTFVVSCEEDDERQETSSKAQEKECSF